MEKSQGTSELKVPGHIRRVLRKIDFKGKKNAEDYKTYAEPVVATIEEANVVTSYVNDPDRQPSPRIPETVEDLEITDEINPYDLHAPVLDFDFPCELIPSTTPGHYHLIMDKEVRWHTYVKVLEAMAAAGLIEGGYADASIQRGYTSIRLPWVTKELPNTEDSEPSLELYL